MQPTMRGALRVVVNLARVCFALTAWLLVALVLTQVFLAGLSIFAGAQNWPTHEGLGWALEFPVFFLLVFSLIARLPWRTVGLAGLLLLLYMVQVTLIIVSRRTGVSEISAFHPVNALLIFWVTLTLARRAFQFFPRPAALARA